MLREHVPRRCRPSSGDGGEGGGAISSASCRNIRHRSLSRVSGSVAIECGRPSTVVAAVVHTAACQVVESARRIGRGRVASLKSGLGRSVSCSPLELRLQELAFREHAAGRPGTPSVVVARDAPARAARAARRDREQVVRRRRVRVDRGEELLRALVHLRESARELAVARSSAAPAPSAAPKSSASLLQRPCALASGASCWGAAPRAPRARAPPGPPPSPARSRRTRCTHLAPPSLTVHAAAANGAARRSIQFSYCFAISADRSGCVAER